MATLLRGTFVDLPVPARARDTMASLLRERGISAHTQRDEVSPPRSLVRRVPLAPAPVPAKRPRRSVAQPARRAPIVDVDRVLHGEPAPAAARSPKPSKARARPRPAATRAQDEPLAAPPLLGRALGPARLLLVGGRVQLDKLARLNARFGDRVDWIATEGRERSLRALERRIHEGGVVGLVLLEGVAKHQHTEPLVRAARGAAVPHAFAGTGGRGAIERAIAQIEAALRRKPQAK